MNPVNQIASAERAVLVDQWQALFNRQPPANTQIAMIRRVLAWHAQAQTSEWKGPQGGARLDRVLRPGAAAAASASLSPGTRLLREWRGATHEVRVLSEGFEYQGSIYKSLTAISRAITGTPWSGPAFFGVRR